METRFFSMCALAVAAIAFVGCNKAEQAIETTEKAGIPFEFIADEIDTKTTNEGAKTNWASGDKVNLFHAVTGSTTYVSDGAFTAGASGASVTFSGTLAESLTADNYDWYAIYPYNSNITTPASTSSGFLTIGSAYNGSQTQNGNDSKAHLAGSKYPVAGIVTNVAKATKPSIAMSHLTSVIAVNVTNGTSAPITVSKVSFTGTEDIVGTYFIDFVSSPVVYTASGPTYVSTTANLNVTSGSAIGAGASATFYLAVKPFTAPASGTISLSVTADNGVQVRNKNLTAATNFVAGTVNTLNFTYDKAAASLPEPSAVTGWYRVEKANWLDVGDRVIIANNDGTKAMITTYKANNRDGVAVTTAASGDYTVLTSNDNVQMFILEEGTASGSFAFWADNGADASKYMCAASSSQNYLRFQDNLDANASFVPTIVDGLGNLTAQGSYTRKVVQWNNLFACYASASQSSISIYKYYGVWTGPTTCAAPVISQEGTTVTITCTTPGATIYYTTNGDDPDPSDNEQKYTHAFSIASAVTVKAIAVKSHYTNSSVAESECAPKVATPVINGLGTSFEITCATEGVTIYYETSTVDLASVSTPTASSSSYTSAVAITQTTYVKAIAVKAGYTKSDVASETCVYSSGGSAPSPVSTNTYSNAATITGSGATQTATWTNGDITISAVRNASGNTSFRSSDTDHTRFYSGWTITVSSAAHTISSVEYTCTSDSYATTLSGYTFTKGTDTASGSVVTVSGVSAGSTAVTLDAQVRISSIRVTYSN